jgi:hypothetical protein
MSDPQPEAEPEHVEVVHPGGTQHDGRDGADAPQEPEELPAESVSSPAKVMRIGSMIKQLLEEVRAASLDEPGRDRLKSIFEESVTQLSESLSPDLADELASLAPPFSSATPSEAELRVAQAQLVGWLEGLFHGIQATLFAQQMAARQQLEQMRGQLPPGVQPPDGGETRPGTYL